MSKGGCHKAGLVLAADVGAALTTAVGLGLPGSVSINFATVWTLPRAVFLGRMTECFMLFLTGIVVLFLWVVHCFLSGSNKIRVSDGSIQEGTWHLTQTTWPARITVSWMPVHNLPWYKGDLPAWMKFTSSSTFSAGIDIASERRVVRTGTSSVNWLYITSSSILNPSSGCSSGTLLMRKGTMMDWLKLPFPCKLTVMSVTQPSKWSIQYLNLLQEPPAIPYRQRFHWGV